MSAQTAIKIESLSKEYLIYDRPIDRLTQMLCRGRKQYYKQFQALKDISFEVNRGEVLGIVGRNGSGKSTLLQLICGTLAKTSGKITVDGRISALLELGSGFNMEFSGKENIYLNATILGLSKAEIDKKYNSILDFAGIGEHINQPVKTYSSGMYVRLAFAVAIATDPDILIVDEALAVGDEMFQRKCFAHFERLIANNATILFVSHSASMITKICHRALLIDAGELLLISNPKEVINYYHKLIYAPSHKILEVKNEILNLSAENPQKPLKQEEQNIDYTAAYLPNLIPETTIRNENQGVTISDVNLYDGNGDKVNHIKRREHYTLKYQVNFTDDATDIRFNLRIRNKEGMFIAGANTTKFDAELQSVIGGEHYHVEFEFDCYLMAETYFIEIGCSHEVDNIRQPLARITDALMFKVMIEPDLAMGGMVDIGLNPHIKKGK